MAEGKKVCSTCGGSGEIGFFQGESRFFITREECPACCGLGYVLEDEEDESPPGDQAEPSPPHDPPK
ncbi:hypothetical protein [Desulfobulbus propionicus]